MEDGERKGVLEAAEKSIDEMGMIRRRRLEEEEAFLDVVSRQHSKIQGA